MVTAQTDTACTVERSPDALTLHLDTLVLNIQLASLTLEVTNRHLRQATDVSDPGNRTTVLPLGVTDLTDGRLIYRCTRRERDGRSGSRRDGGCRTPAPEAWSPARPGTAPSCP